MTNRRWIIVNICFINPRRDAPRYKLPLASQLRGFPENPGMLKRSAGVSALPSTLTWRNQRRGWLTAAAWAWPISHMTGKVNENKKDSGTKNTQAHKRTSQAEPPTLSLLFSFQTVTGALPCPRGVHKGVWACTPFSEGGLTVWWTLVSFQRDVFFISKAANSRLSCTFPRVLCEHFSGHAQCGKALRWSVLIISGSGLKAP